MDQSPEYIADLSKCSKMPNTLTKHSLHVSKWYPQRKKSRNVTFCTSGCPCMQTTMISLFHKLRCTIANTNSVLPFRHYNIVVVTFRRSWLGNQCCSTLHSGCVRSEEEYPWWMMRWKRRCLTAVPASTAVLYRERYGVFDNPVRSHHGKCHKVPREDTNDAITVSSKQSALFVPSHLWGP